jgi:hypothetical protein
MSTTETMRPSVAEPATEKHYRWRWVYGETRDRYYDVWIEPDGSLHNPRNYPEDKARAAVLRADADKAKRMAESAAMITAAEFIGLPEDVVAAFKETRRREEAARQQREAERARQKAKDDEFRRRVLEQDRRKLEEQLQQDTTGWTDEELERRQIYIGQLRWTIRSIEEKLKGEESVSEIGTEAPNDIGVPYCPKCDGKRFRLTDTDTVCVQCGELFANDSVPFRPMKEEERLATVIGLDGAEKFFPKSAGVEISQDKLFHWMVRGAK